MRKRKQGRPKKYKAGSVKKHVTFNQEQYEMAMRLCAHRGFTFTYLMQRALPIVIEFFDPSNGNI